MFTHTEAKAAAQTALSGLTFHCRRGAQLWLNEARATVPSSWLARFGQLARPVLTIRHQDSAICGVLEGGATAAEVAWPARELSIEGVVEWLEAHQLSRDEVRIQVMLEAERFFHRKILIPRAALSSLKSIIAQDIVHRTPFEPADIWHTARPAPMQMGATSLRSTIGSFAGTARVRRSTYLVFGQSRSTRWLCLAARRFQSLSCVIPALRIRLWLDVSFGWLRRRRLQSRFLGRL